MKRNLIIILAIAIIIIGIIAGIAIYSKSEKKHNENNIIQNELNEISEEIIDECTEEWEEMQEQATLEIQTNSTQEKISPNCLITLKRYYKVCDHTINEYIDIPQNLVNKTQDDLEQQYLNWEIQDYSNTKIILYREFDSDCGQHYILRSNDGKITIYKIDENNEEKEFQKTEISVDYLTETDKIEIENGIRVNGMEELNQLIENFE